MKADVDEKSAGASSGRQEQNPEARSREGSDKGGQRSLQAWRFRGAISALTVALISGSAGYLLRAPANASLTRGVVPAECFSSPDSYSRVENTKNTLEALANETRLEMMEATVAYDRLVSHGQATTAEAAKILESATQAAQTAVREFEGTEEQLWVLQSLFALLNRSGRFELWTQLYLKALYEHPGHEILSQLANEALRISKLAGREQEVRDALQYVAARPVDSTAKDELKAALNSAHPWLAQLEPELGNPEALK